MPNLVCYADAKKVFFRFSDVSDVSILFLLQMIWVRFKFLTRSHFSNYYTALSQDLVVKTTLQLGKRMTNGGDFKYFVSNISCIRYRPCMGT